MGGRSLLRTKRKQDLILIEQDKKMKKVDQGKAETAAEIYSNIKMKTMVAITASFFGLMVLAFISVFLKAQ